MANNSRSINLTTLLGIMAAVLILIISLFVSVILYSDFKFNKSVLERSELILSRGLLKGAMPLAIAANDQDLIRSIVHDHIGYDEIYAVEVRNVRGEQIYREEKKTVENIDIIPKNYEILSPYKSVSLDSFDAEADTGQSTLGTVTIYFSTDRIQDSVRNQLYFAVGTIISAICICFLLIYFFKLYLSARLSLVVNLMNAIKRGEKLESYKRPIGVNELTIVDSALRDMVKTLYERDNELKISLENALEAKTSAQEAEEFKDDFIRAISHDIKTPVGVIVNLLAMINDDVKEANIDKGLVDKVAACHKSAKVLADVTSELFDLEQFQRKELLNKINEASLSEVFDKIKSLYSQKFSQKGIMFKVVNNNQVGYMAPETVMLDESKLILILENLIDNALKFTNDGSVIVAWEVECSSLKVSVRDSGIGIEEDKLNLIFEKHKQLGDVAIARKDGRGLGLFYVNRLIDVIHGKLKVSSKLGIGSIFEFCIPFETVDVEPCRKVECAQDPINVLIIDDNEEMCFMLKNIFERMNIASSYECIPEIGFSRLIKEKPELVIIDYHMPNLSGDEIAKRAQAIFPANASCFVCITAEASASKLKVLEGIFHVVLRKPLSDADIGKLKDLVNLVMRSKTVAVSALTKMVDE